MIPAPRSSAEDPDPGPAGPVPGDAAGEAMLGDVCAMSLEDLRRQHRLLRDELRGVRYWRRIAQAQTDLLVAGLIYHDHEDLDGLHGIGAAAGGQRLQRLRERGRMMAGHERALREELDLVADELAARLVHDEHQGPTAR